MGINTMVHTMIFRAKLLYRNDIVHIRLLRTMEMKYFYSLQDIHIVGKKILISSNKSKYLIKIRVSEIKSQVPKR